MDRNEFQNIAAAVRPRLVAMLMSISTDIDAHDADDIAQDTLLKLWTMREELDRYRSFEALASVTARRRAIDLLRLRSSHPSATLDEALTLASSSSEPDRELMRTETSCDIDEIFASLPPGQSALLRMKHIEGMEVAEIARLTGSTPGAVRTALSRARQNVKLIFMQRQEL